MGIITNLHPSQLEGPLLLSIWFLGILALEDKVSFPGRVAVNMVATQSQPSVGLGNVPKIQGLPPQ